jgi:hypothetical protein
MAVSSAGLRPRNDCSGKAQKQLYSKLQTCPLVREGASKQYTRNCLKEISKRKKNWSWVPDGRLTPRQIGRLTVSRNVTSTSMYNQVHLGIQLNVSRSGCDVTQGHYATSRSEDSSASLSRGRSKLQASGGFLLACSSCNFRIRSCSSRFCFRHFALLFLNQTCDT